MKSKTTYTSSAMLRRAGAILIGTMFVVGPAGVFAQEGPGPAKIKSAKDKPAKEKAAKPAKTGFDKALAADAAKLSAKNKKKRGEAMVNEVRRALSRASDLLRDAREARDSIKLVCVNGKRTQIKGLLDIADRAYVQMLEALSSTKEGAESDANVQFLKITVAHQKALNFKAEMESKCAGASSIYSGDTKVEVVVEGEEASGEDNDPTTAGETLPPVNNPVASSS